MARTKQATPIRREPSSEYISKSDRSPKRMVATPTEVSPKANGKAAGGAVAPAPSTKEAGVVTLIIDVAGIYASLYVPRPSPSSTRQQTNPPSPSAASHGPTSRKSSPRPNTAPTASASSSPSSS
jgi:hypothetical protein